MSDAGPAGAGPSTGTRGPVAGAILGVAYVACAMFGDFLAGHSALYVTFWLPAGAYLAALLLRPRQEWPWLVGGAFLGNALFDLPRGTPIPVFLMFQAANVSQALLGAWLVNRFVGLKPRLSSLRDFFGVVGLGGVVATLPGAAIGTATLVGYGFSDDAFHSFRTWWGSCSMAVLLLVPCALAWQPGELGTVRSPLTRRWAEFALVSLVTMLFTYWLLVMQRGIHGPHKYALFPAVLWTGVRFGIRGAALLSLLIGLGASYFTNTYGVGLTPLDLGAGAHVFTLQTFTAVVSLVSLVPAIALSERDASVGLLREREAHYRTLVDAAFEGIAISENGVILDANDQLLRMFGYTREEFVGRSIPEFVAPESRDIVRDSIKKGRAEVYQHFLLRKDGSRFPAEAQARVVEQGGRSLRLTAIRDVTARMEAEAAARAGEALLREFIEHAPAAIAMFDREMRYLQVSERWLRDYHLDGRQIIGKSHYEVFPDIPDDWKRVHQRAMAGAIERRDEDPFPRADGSIEWLEWEIRPWTRPDGTIGGLVFFTQVITQRKQEQARQRALEQQLRQAQKMDAIGTLAGGIAHDFNNILGAIVAHNELAKMDNPDNVELVDNLNQISIACSRAASLVQQILTFSRQQPKERRGLQLRMVVREALKLLRSTLPSTIEVVQRIDETPAVLADATHMHQVIVNLCTNAHHAMRGRPGKLTVELDTCELAGEQAALLHVKPGRFVRLSISDTGSGISEEVLPRIFEPFFTTKPQHEGTGLGLSVVHGIISEHEGAIAVESKLGEGSAFRVLLPALETSVEGTAPPSNAMPRGTGQRLLVVDDEASLAEATGKLLERSGYLATTATRAEAAWSIFSLAPEAFDAVLTDLTMPELDGIELATRVLSLRPDVPVLLVTGSLTESTEERAAKAGVRCVLLKPLDQRVLLTTLQQVVPGKRTRTD